MVVRLDGREGGRERERERRREEGGREGEGEREGGGRAISISTKVFLKRQQRNLYDNFPTKQLYQTVLY